MPFSQTKPDVKNKIKYQKNTHWLANKTLLSIGVVIALPLGLFLTISLIFPLLTGLTTYLFSPQKLSFHPTSIPWIDNASECEHTDRSWHDGKCWDEKHSSSF